MHIKTLLGALAVLTLPMIATAQDAEESSPEFVHLDFLYAGEAWKNVQGGEKRAGASLHNVDVVLAIDADRGLGWEGATFLVNGFYNSGSTIETLTGAAQGNSAIDTGGVEMFRLYQAWYNQEFNGGRSAVLFGLYDLNSEFDMFDAAGLFFNGATGFTTTLDQTGLNGASTYPNTSLATRFTHKLSDTWAVQAAILDGVPQDPDHPKRNALELSEDDGALLIAEVNHMPDDTTKYLAGLWHYTADFDDVVRTDAGGNPVRHSNNTGGYIGGGTRLYNEDDEV
jgi:porin